MKKGYFNNLYFVVEFLNGVIELFHHVLELV